MDYLKLFNHHGHYIRKHVYNFEIGIIRDSEWAGVDFSNQPWGIFIKDMENKITLFSYKRYRFDDRDSATEFAISRSYADIQLMFDELTIYNRQLNEKLKEKVEKEAIPFYNALQENNIDYMSFCKLHTMYHNLPRHIRKYYKVKHNNEL